MIWSIHLREVPPSEIRERANAQHNAESAAWIRSVHAGKVPESHPCRERGDQVVAAVDAAEIMVRSVGADLVNVSLGGNALPQHDNPSPDGAHESVYVSITVVTPRQDPEAAAAAD